MNTDTQVQILLIELARVKAEAAELRKRFGVPGRHPKRIERALEDAILLSMVKVSGIHPSRRLAAFLGMSQSRWEHALGLLRMARVVTRNRHWVTTDLPTIEARLQAAKERAISDKELFFLRHSRHRRQW